ncbi:hypothetical protein [Halorhabdus salina]|uniref:hypothetical protein n=1 Tax=Halorhabdus salina TaxID=2750670 RepID=UPI0015EEB152|nr:hypothetical protein [Halorhabdus salina]
MVNATVDQSYQTYCPKCGAEGTHAEGVDSYAYECTNQACGHTWAVSSNSRIVAGDVND